MTLLSSSFSTQRFKLVELIHRLVLRLMDFKLTVIHPTRIFMLSNSTNSISQPSLCMRISAWLSVQMALPPSMVSVFPVRAHARLAEVKLLDARGAYKINQLSSCLVTLAMRSVLKEPFLMRGKRDALDVSLGALSVILMIKRYVMSANKGYCYMIKSVLDHAPMDLDRPLMEGPAHHLVSYQSFGSHYASCVYWQLPFQLEENSAPRMYLVSIEK
jgi:hypothetical protein